MTENHDDQPTVMQALELGAELLLKGFALVASAGVLFSLSMTTVGWTLVWSMRVTSLLVLLLGFVLCTLSFVRICQPFIPRDLQDGPLMMFGLLGSVLLTFSVAGAVVASFLLSFQPG